MRYRPKSVAFALTFALLLLIAACARQSRQIETVTSNTNNGISTAPPAKNVEKRNIGLVRVIGAIPSGAGLDVFTDNTKAFANVAYKTVTPYKEQPDERHTFRLRPAGQNAAQPLAENTAEIDDGEHFTIIAVPGANNKPTLKIVSDKLTRPQRGKAKVRVIHAAPDVGKADLYAQGKEDELFDGVSFQSASDYKEVDPMNGALEVRPEDQKNAVLTIPSVRFEAGKIYTIIVMGRAKGTPKLEAITVEDQLGSPRAAAGAALPPGIVPNRNANGH